MALDPQLPQSPTLTLKPTKNVPPDKPPEPSISMLFPENTPYRAPANPFRGPLSKALDKEHKQALREALGAIREPFLFAPEEPIVFNGEGLDTNISSESFQAAATTVIAAMERGYYPTRDPTPLSPSGWASLACTLMAAIGRGYHRQYASDQDANLEKVRAGAIDPDPLSPQLPTLFHRLAATAGDVSHHVGTDQEGYQDWYLTIKKHFTVKATKAAAAEVDEKWLLWKADQIDRRGAAYETEIAANTRKRGEEYLIATAERLGLHIVRGERPTTPITGIRTGRKRSASGSECSSGPTRPSTPAAIGANPPPPPPPPQTAERKLSAAGSTTPMPTPEPMELDPTTPKATRVNPPRAAKRSASTSPAPVRRGRDSTPGSQPTTRVDPSPTPRPRKKTVTPPTLPGVGTEDAEALTTTLLTKILARLEALERKSMPPPVRQPAAQPKPTPAKITPREVNDTTKAPHAPQPTEKEDFTLVGRNGKGSKGRGKSNLPQVGPAPASYANAAAVSAGIKQPTPPPKAAARLPAITEVTVLRAGNGSLDPLLEQNIRARAADAITREVRLQMCNAVANPILLRAGRWSAHPRSKGNFVYSFDGNISFDVILSYERMLLAPFHGTGKLSPSMGWTRLLAHGVPVFGEYYNPTGPEELLKEVRMMPGLKKAHFAMPPRWLKPVHSISTDYSTITFAISDPDGTATNTLMKGRAALFGKEVEIQKWIDKPTLVQCSHCHALSHIRTSRACPLGKNAVKCYICGGAHQSEAHNQKCPRKHKDAGFCDCNHFKCINCHQTGHNAKDTRCPARELYRPRTKRRTKANKNKGKEGDWEPGREPVATPTNHAGAYITEDTDEDLYQATPNPPNPTSRQARTEKHHMSCDNICDRYDSDLWMETEGASGSGNGLDYDRVEFPEAWNDLEPMDAEFATIRHINYSPSRPQGDVANVNLA